MTSQSATIARTTEPGKPSIIAPWPMPLPAETLTVVSGAAGSGKTTLLEQWACQVEATDSIAVRHRATARLTPEAILQSLAVSMDRSDLAYIFIDDADRLERGVLQELLRALDRRDNWRLAVTCRGPLGADLDGFYGSRLRVIDQRELTLSTDAVEQIISPHRPDLTSSQLKALAEKVGGWAIGAQLAGRAMSATIRLDEAVAGFSGASRLVSDYLDAEIFDTLSCRDREFLVACSVLPELTPESCTLLTGDHFSAERLSRLKGRNVLITDGPGTWRWSPLARDYLLAKLDRQPPAEVAELRRRARGWSTARGAFADAVGHGVATADWNAVVGIILNAGPKVAADGDPESVLEWLRRLPRSILETEAGLSVVAAFALWTSEGDDASPDIADWVGNARRIGTGRPPAQAGSVEVATLVAEAAFSPDGPGRRIELARSLLDEVELGPSWRAFVCWVLGMAAYFDDQPRLARLALTDYLDSGAAARNGRQLRLDPGLAEGAIGALALIELDAGNLDRPGILTSAAGLIPDTASSRSKSIGTLELAVARRGLPTSGDHIESLQQLGSSALLHEVRVLALLELARVYADHGEPAAHRESLAAADQLLRTMTAPGRLIARRRNAADHRPGGVDDPAGNGTLTERELEVLRLLASDLSRRQIAEQLFLAHNTVKTYVQRIYRKLGVSSRTAAVARGRERGWIS